MTTNLDMTAKVIEEKLRTGKLIVTAIEFNYLDIYRENAALRAVAEAAEKYLSGNMMDWATVKLALKDWRELTK